MYWKNLNEIYSVSDDGQVRNTTTGKILRLFRNNRGYMWCTLYLKKGCPKNFFVHRLVAELFLDNPQQKPTVNHKDGNKENNVVDNLEWSTYSENHLHSVASGFHPTGENHYKVRLTVELVKQLRAEYDGTNSFLQKKAKELSIHPNTIKLCVDRKTWKTVSA